MKWNKLRSSCCDDLPVGRGPSTLGQTDVILIPTALRYIIAIIAAGHPR